MKILMIGGTGLISTAVTKLAVLKGIDLYLMNRGIRKTKIEHTHELRCDIHDEACVEEALKNHHFDAIVDWIAFTVDHVKRDYRLFKGKTDQYVFISSASAYQKPIPFLPITEEIPLENKYWQYSQNKANCETYLKGIKDPDFHVTIIRPSHTYDEKSLVFQIQTYQGPFTIINRMLNLKPIVLPDDGNSKWTLTDHRDFAHAFIDILGNSKAYDDFFHLTSEMVFTWNDLAKSMYKALHLEEKIIYIPTDFILKHFPELKGDLYGDKKDDAIFDNSKIKKIAPNYRSSISYIDQIPNILTRYLSDSSLQVIDPSFDSRYDELIKDYLNQR